MCVIYNTHTFIYVLSATPKKEKLAMGFDGVAGMAQREYEASCTGPVVARVGYVIIKNGAD